MADSIARSGVKQLRERLRKLQDIDGRIQALNQQCEAIKRGVRQALHQLTHSKNELNSRALEQKGLEVKLKEKELDLNGKEESVRRLTVQLNTAKSNREYSTFKHEIAVLRADASMLEDEILQMMEDSDERQRSQKTLIAETKAQEEQLAATERAAEEESARLDSEVEALQGQRETLCAEIDSETLALYQRLVKNKDGQAVVTARNRSCTGCHMTLTQNSISYLMGDSSLVRCHSCGRILYLEEEG